LAEANGNLAEANGNLAEANGNNIQRQLANSNIQRQLIICASLKIILKNPIATVSNLISECTYLMLPEPEIFLLAQLPLASANGFATNATHGL